jgi:hypothetical protein
MTDLSSNVGDDQIDTQSATQDATQDASLDAAQSSQSGQSKGAWASSPVLRMTVYAVAVVVVVALIYYFAVPRSLTTRLEKAGWFLFLSPTCPHCKRQLEVLGGHYSQSAQCSGGKTSGSPPIPCSKIGAFPTWYNTKSGETVKGMRSVSQLEEMLAHKK